MDTIKKQGITNKLRSYCDRYGSQNRAAASLRGVSASTVSQILSGKTELVSDVMWRSIAAQIGYKDNNWEPVETTDFKLLTRFFTDAKEDDNPMVLAITGNAGTGKTFTARHYADNNKNVYMLCCAEFWTRRVFMQELLTAMGIDHRGNSINEMMAEAVHFLKTDNKPLLILDEADKLTDQVFYFFITLYNRLENECGIVLLATKYLEKRLRRSADLSKRGYEEIWSRVGKKCIVLKGVGAADIVAICEANGITSVKEIESIIEDSESDLRRVRRKIQVFKKSAAAARTA